MLLINDSKLRESYFGQARDYIESLEYGSSSQEFYKLVNAHIQGIFERAYLDRL